MNNRNTLIFNRVFRSLGSIGIKQVDIANKFKLSKGAVHQWKFNGIPSDYCASIEELLKVSNDPVSRLEMRPDDWHKWWPELKQSVSTNSGKAA